MHNKSKTLLLSLVLTLLSPAALAQSPAEQSLLQLANQARAQHSLPPLRWDANLAQAAQAHLQWVRRNPDNLLHQYPGEPDLLARGAHTGARFATIAENIGARGESPASLQQIWMTTPTHRANLLDPNLNVVGIAVSQDNANLLYAVEDFGHNVPSLPSSSVEQHVQQLLQAQGIAPAPSNEDARKTCTMPTGSVGTAKLVIQWDGADIDHLPDAILQQLSQTKYASAAVGACPGRQPNSQFTTYHIAVLLY
jgi:Cysteine-rich secretory protein family